MRIRFNLRTMFLAVFLVAVVLWFFTPVAAISSATCARVRPGMTEQQASEIVGAPPGWYDGVGGIRTEAPAFKGYVPTWTGLRGKILVELDGSGHVAQATFYPGEVSDWSLTEYLWERFTRVHYLGISLASRIALHLALSAVAVFMLGIVMTRANAKDRLALHGLIGLVVGAILSVATFADGFFSDLLMTALTLAGPILGAIVGIVIGLARSMFTRRPARKSTQDDPVASAIVG